jgi:hypothetical protein
LVEDFEEDESPLQAEVEARIIARVCKRAAVKAGKSLSPEEPPTAASRRARRVVWMRQRRWRIFVSSAEILLLGPLWRRSGKADS